MTDSSTEPGERFQPKAVSDVLVDAFRLFTANWLEYMLVAALLVIPLTLLQVGTDTVFAGSTEDPVVDLRTAVVGLVGAVLTLVIQLVVTGALARSGATAIAGLPVGAADSARYALGRLGSLLWVIILETLLVVGGAILLLLPALVVTPMIALLGIVAALFVVGTVVMLYVSVPSFVVEGRRGSEALSRSWQLVGAHFWHVVGVALLTTIVTSLASSILGALGGDSVPGQWLFSTIGLLLVVPYSALVVVVLYVELRARAEGLTVDELRSDLARTAMRRT